MYRNFFKRLFDIFGALAGLVLFSPVILFVTIYLSIRNRGSAFFLQERAGKGGRIFRIIKFKTMTDERDGDGRLLPDDARLTGFGRFLRSTSLDELPQLVNVLNGNMSLVGPRPLLVQYLPLYSARQARRHEVLPGITGWAQCHGRNAISWKEKLELDVWYVEHLSFVTDCRIMLLTILKVIKKEGITQQGKTTVELFNGNN
ncbi:MAG: sugar transferase [Bacteroidales bacterium]|nr:sugar transferase [Bacteroidales bacterium]